MTARAALVVGGSRGIGRASAVELARRGFTDVLLGYVADEEAAQEAAGAVAEAGAKTSLVRADAATAEGVESLAGACSATGAPLEAVVYAAGYRWLAPALSFDEQQWQRTFDVTVTGFVRSVQAVAPQLPPGAKVVGVSGLSGLRAYSDLHLTMGTAKAAVHHAAGYLARELAGRGVNLNVVCCGSVRTEGVERDLTPEQYDAFVTGAAQRIPRGRIAEVEEVARLVAFLCSPDADLLVGQVIVADGGETLR